MTPASSLRSSRGWFLAVAACVALKLWLVVAQPVVAIGPAGHDDRLYLELAARVLRGEWLGTYDQFTLMKGPAYPLWIAGTFLAGVPLPLAQHLLYLAGCAWLVLALRPYLRSAWQPAALFLVLWWNPMSYELPVLGRVLRQNLYTPAGLCFFAGLIALDTRRSAPARTRLAWGALLGLSGGVLWLTREETVWIFPSAALLIAAAGWTSWRAGEKARPLLAPLLTAGLLATALIGGVCSLNYRAYGWFGTVEFRAPEFISAYGSLQRIVPTRYFPYVPVTREAREKAYAVSPAFAELRPFLEGDLGLGWAGAATALTGQPREAREIAGGWFMWALRDAVIAAGYKRNAADTLAFYDRIAREVNLACDTGRLTATPRHDTLVPPWRRGHPTRLAREWRAYVSYFLTFQDFSALPAPSLGSAQVLNLFSDLTRWKLSPSPEATELERPLQNRLDGWRLATLDAIGRGFAKIASVANFAAIPAALGLLARAVWRRRGDPRLIVALSAAGACLAVVAINLLVHIMAFSNRSPGAFAQAYPLLLLFTSLVAIGVFEAVRETSAASRGSSAS